MTSEDILLAPLHTPPAYAAVVDRLRRAIALGVVLPGERLPSERTLADRLEVSRVTVREALRVLQGEGLLVTRRGSSGSVVAAGATSLDKLGEEYKAEVGEVFEYRMAVETMAARLAAQRGSEDQIAQLLSCQESLAASSDVDSFRRADSEFHLTVAAMSGNMMLRQSVEDARAAAFSWLDLREFRVFHESSIRGHSTIINAISRHDPDEAAAAMAAHIDQAHDEVLAALADTPAPKSGRTRSARTVSR
ncbi:FadR family transcriptional regulator [Planosporangium thailandense]|uniref:FadR family transcriptional regulator n=1 Tax=Planosporangium thailandense TaxID=765197 RepID=A0ABX0Y3U6_9ACTN|nr:FCD domain-containing protein [Planosporangium thailandense]NJC73066.1 FadR family transcriptional regulator [Planosporangium thailandense]